MLKMLKVMVKCSTKQKMQVVKSLDELVDEVKGKHIKWEKQEQSGGNGKRKFVVNLSIS